ncbi:hypothetical protein L7F22_002869 [Adiantum nelumboides]|nr:hypothetical protein [Adiantum nelumboides]
MASTLVGKEGFVCAKRKLFFRTVESLLSAQEFFDSFLRSRQLRNDFVSKASDVLWKRELWDVDEEKLNQVRARLAELQKLREEDDSVGYLKLSQAKQWGLGYVFECLEPTIYFNDQAGYGDTRG